MRAVIQRVSEARVCVSGQKISEIGQGLLVFLGVGHDDGDEDISWMAEKICGLRIFSDAEGKMNRSVMDIEGEVLVVSQFTLMGDARKGRRPGFDQAARPELADRIYQDLVDALRKRWNRIATGVFRADMAVELVNDGPVTLLLDSRKAF